MNEFLKMLGDPAHWAFEITVTLIIDVLLVGIFWPLLRKSWQMWSISRELGARAEFTAHLADANFCDECGSLPTRIDTSVDLCGGCGSVSVPTRKPIQPTPEQFKEEQTAAQKKQALCDHICSGVNLLDIFGICLLCHCQQEKSPKNPDTGITAS